MFVSKLKTVAVVWTLVLFLENALSFKKMENTFDYKQTETLARNELGVEGIPPTFDTLQTEREHNILTELTKNVGDLKSAVQTQEFILATVQEKQNDTAKFIVSNTCGDTMVATRGLINYIHKNQSLEQSFPMNCMWRIRTEREFTKITTNQGRIQRAAYVFELTDGEQKRLKPTQLRPANTQVFQGPLLIVWLSIPDPYYEEFTFQLLFEGLGEKYAKFDNQLSHFTHQFLGYSPSHQISFVSVSTPTIKTTSLSVVTLISNFSSKTFININDHNVNCPVMETMLVYVNLKQEGGEVPSINCCVSNCNSIVTTLDSPFLAIIVKRYDDPLHLSLLMLSESLYEHSYVYHQSTNCGGVISGLSGVIDYKSAQQYDNNERCVWAIVPGRYATKTIRISVSHNGLEPQYDKLYMMEILDKNGSILANTPKITNLTDAKVKYLASGMEAYIVFYTDMSITGKGFRIKYTFEPEEGNHANIYNEYDIQSGLNGSIFIKMADWQRQQHSIVITPKVEQSQVDSVLQLYFTSPYDGESPCQMPNYLNVFVPINGIFYQLSEPLECELSDRIRTVMLPVTKDAMALIIVDNGHSDFDVETIVRWEITEVKQKDMSYIKTDGNQCGGVIKANSGVIQYKLDANLQPHEACIWTIVTENGMLDLKLVKEGLHECCSSLSLFTVDKKTATLTLQRVLSQSNPNIQVDSSVAIIVLKADKRQNGTGFYVEFGSTGNSNTQTNFIATHNMQPSGRHSLIWRTSSDDDSAYAQTIHIFSHNSNVSDFLQINSNFKYGLFQMENECTYETITVYGFEVNGERRLAQLPRPEDKADCQEFIAVAKINPWFTTSSAAFVVIQRIFSRNPTTSFDWEQQRKKERPFPPEIERRKWHNGIVKYTIDTATLDATTIQTLEATFREFETKTCIRFEPRQPEDKVYTEFRGGDDCKHVGGCGMDGKQTTSFGPRCRAVNSMANLIMLTLCFPRYEQRPDRNQWLNYNECGDSNKQPPKIDPDWPVGESLFDYATTSSDACCQCNAMGKPTMSGVDCAQCGWNVTRTLGIMDPDMINELYDCQGCYRHRWRKIENVEKIPPNDMVKFANHSDGQQLAACRGYVNGEVVIGNFLPSSKICSVSYAGNGYELTKDAQIFTLPEGQLDMPGASYRLIDKNNVGKCGMGNMIPACRTYDGRPGYVGVVSFDSRSSVGKVWYDMVMFYPLDGKEIGFPQAYQVLTCG